MIDIDILYRTARLGYRLAEFPVHWTNDPERGSGPCPGPCRISAGGAGSGGM
jgi:hypothetical protein